MPLPCDGGLRGGPGGAVRAAIEAFGIFLVVSGGQFQGFAEGQVFELGAAAEPSAVEASMVGTMLMVSVVRDVSWVVSWVVPWVVSWVLPWWVGFGTGTP